MLWWWSWGQMLLWGFVVFDGGYGRLLLASVCCWVGFVVGFWDLLDECCGQYL